MSMLQKIITSGTTPTYPSMWYHHDTNWAAKAVSVAADRYTLQSPDAIQVDVGGVSLTQYSKQMLDLSLDTNWDFGQGTLKTWSSGATYNVSDYIRPTINGCGDGSSNVSVTYATSLMTANNAPSPAVVSASGVEAGSAIFQAFNQNTSDSWGVNHAVDPQWLKYDFGSGNGKVINKFRFYPYSSAQYCPRRWTLEGSNDDSNWTKLHTTYENATYTTVGGTWTEFFTFSNSTTYRYYILRINLYGGSGYTYLNELQLVQDPRTCVYVCTSGGTVDSTEPTWTGNVGATITDGGVTWTCVLDETNANSRAGQDFYVYSVARSEGSVPKLICSANATYPINYNASTSRKIAGFHCLSNTVGANCYGTTAHSLYGYVTGDILPLSVWDVHRKSSAISGNVGQVYNTETGKWAGIYPVSGSVSVPTIVYGGTILQIYDWNDSVDVGKVANMFLPSDAGFQSQAAGSNEQTSIYGSAIPSPATTIGYVDTAGTRMISNIGCESCCGLIWSWLDEQSYRFDAAAAHTHNLVLTGAITGATVAAGGTGYSVNDVLTVVSATGINGTVTVATVDAGAVLTVTVTTAGTLYTNAGNPHAVTGGGGADCTLTITTAATKTSAVASADVAPAWGWQAASGSKGSIYKQGTRGDTKVIAGGHYVSSGNCGSRCRRMDMPRYNASIIYPGVGVRLIANSIEK